MERRVHTAAGLRLTGLILVLGSTISIPNAVYSEDWNFTHWKGQLVYKRTYGHQESFNGGRSNYDYRNHNTEELRATIEFTVSGLDGGSTRTPLLDVLYSEDRFLYCKWQRPSVLCCPDGEWGLYSCKNPERITPGDHGKQDYTMTTRGSEGDGYVELNVTSKDSFALRTTGSVSYVGAETGEEWIYDVCRGEKTNEHKRNKLLSGQTNWSVLQDGRYCGGVIQGYKVVSAWTRELKRIPTQCNCLFGCFTPDELDEGEKAFSETISWHVYKTCSDCPAPLIFPPEAAGDHNVTVIRQQKQGHDQLDPAAYTKERVTIATGTKIGEITFLGTSPGLQVWVEYQCDTHKWSLDRFLDQLIEEVAREPSVLTQLQSFPLAE